MTFHDNKLANNTACYEIKQDGKNAKPKMTNLAANLIHAAPTIIAINLCPTTTISLHAFAVFPC